MENNVYCTKCNSTHIHSDTKGFSAGKALVGGVLTGGVGLLAGFIGSKKIYLTCLNCGHQFMLDELLKLKEELREQEEMLNAKAEDISEIAEFLKGNTPLFTKESIIGLIFILSLLFAFVYFFIS